MNIDASKLPESFFSPTAQAVNEMEAIKEMRIEKEHDVIFNLSNAWALLPVEERNKIRKETSKTNIKRSFKLQFGKTMEWISSLMCVVMAAILLSLFLRWLL